MIFQTSMIMFHVNFEGCIYSKHPDSFSSFTKPPLAWWSVFSTRNALHSVGQLAEFLGIFMARTYQICTDRKKTGKLEGVTQVCLFLGHDKASIISNVPANWSDID